MIQVTRLKAYISNAGIYLLASLITSLLSVLINPLLAMNMSPEDYAVVSYYTSFGTLFTPLIVFFTIDYYCRKYYIVTEDERRVLKGNLFHFFIFFSGGVSILCLLGLYIFVTTTGVSFSFYPYALLVISQLFFGVPYSFQLAEYKIAGKSKQFFFVSIIWGIANVILTLTFVVWYKGGGVGKLLATSIGSLLPFVWCIYKNRCFFKTKIDKSIIQDMLKFGLPLTLAGLLGFFTNGYDKVLLEEQGNVVALGYYAVACQMSAYLNIFSNAIKSTFQPDMFKAISQRNLKKVALVILGVILSVSFIVGIYILFSPWLVNILTAGRYVASTELSQITALSIITSTVYYQISQFTYGTGHSNITLVNKIIGVIATIVLLNVLIPSYGTYGAAWGMVISYIFYALGNIILLYTKRKTIFEK